MSTLTSDPRSTFADGLASAANSLHDRAESLAGGDKIVRAAESAAGAMESAAGYVRSQDLPGMASDLGRMVRRHPVATLAIAGAVGYLLVRALSSDRI